MRAVALCIVLVACVSPARELPACVEAAPAAGPTTSTGGDPVLLAAGDIIGDQLGPPAATARLLDRYDGVVATLGDNLNTHGALADYFTRYEPTWGRHRWRTRPSVGNHDYMTEHAAPYFAYFCAAAGTPFEGWYSYDLGAWHIVVLNSECADPFDAGPSCAEGSPQVEWLARDLAAHPSACTLAYWHHPKFSSDEDGDHPKLRAFWSHLYDAGADIVLNGHAHDYERFAPMTPDGARDPEHGIREIIAGIGGAALTVPPHVRDNSELQIAGMFGIMRLALHARSYEWEVIDVDGVTRDAGSGTCHRGG